MSEPIQFSPGIRYPNMGPPPPYGTEAHRVWMEKLVRETGRITRELLEKSGNRKR